MLRSKTLGLGGGNNLSSSNANLLKKSTYEMSKPNEKDKYRLMGGSNIAFASILEDGLEQLSLLSNISIDPDNMQGDDKNGTQHNQTKQTHTVKGPVLKKKEKIAIQNARKIARQRSTIHEISEMTVSQLISEHAFNALQDFVHDEMNKQDLLENTIQREKEASATLDLLSRQIQREKDLFQKEQQEKDAIIQQLKDAIDEIQQLVQSEHKFLRAEIKAKHTTMSRSWRMHEEDMSKEITLTYDKLNEEQRVHQKIMSFLDYQRELLDQSTLEWSAKYEQDMLAKTRQLDELKSKRANETDEFERSVVEYENLEKFIEAYNVEKSAREDEDQKERTMDRAARKIQKFWRKVLKKKKESASVNPKKGKGGKKK